MLHAYDIAGSSTESEIKIKLVAMSILSLAVKNVHAVMKTTLKSW